MNDSKSIEKNMFKIVNDKGEEVDCEVLFTFSSPPNENKETTDYIIYTDNTKNEDGDIKVYASKYDSTFETKDLQPIESKEEWEMIENIFASLQDKYKNEGDR